MSALRTGTAALGAKNRALSHTKVACRYTWSNEIGSDTRRKVSVLTEKIPSDV